MPSKMPERITTIHRTLYSSHSSFMNTSNNKLKEISAEYFTALYRPGFKLPAAPSGAARAPFIFLLCATLLGAHSAAGQTATWAGGNSYGLWSNTNNWSPQVEPLNGGGATYTVIVPDSTSLSFDAPGGGAIDALSFGVGSQLLVTNGHSLTVNGVAVLKGQIQAGGPGSAFFAPANTVILSSNPQFLATNGAAIAVGASTYSWDRWTGSATLLSAVGNNSVVDLHGVSSMLLSYGNNNPTYVILARSNGMVDLSGLANLVGPGSGGMLELDVDSGGQLKLDSARQLSQNLRFNLGVSEFQLPQAVSMDSVTINQTATGELAATNLMTIANSTINSATGGLFNLPSLATIASSTLNLTTGAVFSAPQLWFLDTVPLNIVGNGSFQATNLAVYLNSAIAVQPGRDVESGLLTNIYGSSISVKGGSTFRVGAGAYEFPGQGSYYTYPPRFLFQSDGPGSVLDLSLLKSILVHGVQYGWDTTINGWRYDWTFFIDATNNGVIDLSGLQTAYGADPNNYGGDDWLSFKVESGGTILLPNLKVVTQRTRFDLQVPQFAMPSLQTVDHTLFNLPDGGKLDVASLTNFNNSSISFGFNSTFNAPQLRTFQNSTLNLIPGQVLSTPPFTNIDASRISVSSGSTLAVAAPAYLAPGGQSATVFSADGAGSLLDLSSVASLNTTNGDSGHTYTVAVNNHGVVNLSGLQTIQAGSDSWQLSLQNSGSILLSSLQQASGSVSFALGAGTRLDLPSLTSVSDGTSISFGAGTVFNAPVLVQFVNSDLSVATPGAFTSLPLTNIYQSRLSVSGGSTLHVAAQSYEIPPYTSYYMYPGSRTRFSADGPGSLLDLSAIQTIRMYGVTYGWDPSISTWRYDWDFMANASNQGVIDLSSLQAVYGADPNNYNGGDDWFSFNARSGGIVKLGNVSVFQRARFSASDPNSMLDFAGLYLRSPGTLTLGPSSLMRVRGDFRFENTDTNTITADLATMLMDGAVPQRLEVGGRDVGPAATFAQGNFGFGQLLVGNTNQQSIVRLVDTLNNGGRGPAGEPESLYLYGLGGQGLRLFSGSRLLLGSINCYALVNSRSVNLKSLIPAGTNSVVFDGGFIANFGGPSITNMSPSVAVTPVVSSVDISFNMPIQATSFTTADVQLSGPAGAITPTGVALVSDTTWRISFPAQTADGTYTVSVGPNINELAGNFLGMDQNGDGRSGDGTNDTFTGTFIIDGTAPNIVRALALQNGTRIGITFDESVAASFATNPANYSVNGLTPTRAVLYGSFSGGILREVFAGIGGGTSVSDLTSAAIYPNNPTFTNWVTDYFESPRGVGDYYGQRMHGYIVPPVSGAYTFWITSDDSSALYLSTDDSPTNQTQIAYASGATGWRNWTAQGNQKSAVIFLQAGKRYYICALQKEGTGDDYVSVRWLRPDGMDEGPIPATYLLPYGVKTPPGPTCVALDVASLVGNTFTLTANNATDLLGNSANRSVTGTILTMEDRDLGVAGNPAVAGSALTFNGDDFEMRAGGNDFFFNNFDAGHFADETRYGDFDVQAQVSGMTTADSCTQAGLMWRESTAANCRRIYVCLNAPGQCNGYSGLIRSTAGANGTEWPSYSRPGVPSFAVSYVWIRLQRQGDVFTAYNSTDGVNWNPYAQVTASLPAVGIVGPASSARNNSGAATVWYKNFGDRVPSIVAQPQGQTVASGSTVSFGVNVRGLPVLAYQWYFNGVPVDGGTSSLLTLNGVAITNVGDYRCVITNNYGSATSLVATLVVDGVGTGGFEADIMPEPNGDNAVTISDWVKVGRLVAGLDAVLNSSEFQRVDCAPRMVGTNLTLGDGRLTVADWTEAGRYAAGLDALTPAGGPTQPVVGPLVKPLGFTPKTVGRNLTVSSLTAWRGAQIEVPVLLSGAQGDENALGFSLTFDPARLAYMGVTLGKDATGASLVPNAVRANDGVLGLALALPVNQSLGSGLLEMARVRFAVVGAAGSVGLQLTDAPVVCELVDTVANTLPMALINGVVQIVPQPGFASVRLLPGGGLEILLSGPSGQACLLQASTNLVDWVTLSTNVLGSAPLPLVDATAPAGKCRFYRLTPAQ
jgi:hypothetical protein